VKNIHTDQKIAHDWR